MSRAPSPRPVRRRDNSLLIFLHPDQWAPDVPLPEGSTIVHMGEKGEIPFHPQWHFSLHPDKTVELLVGWFILPFPFEDAIAWYEGEMAKCGWVHGPREGYRKPREALLRFQKPEARLGVEIEVQWWPYKQETTAMIRRMVEHPWSPAGEEASERHSLEEALPLEEVPVAV